MTGVDEDIVSTRTFFLKRGVFFVCVFFLLMYFFSFSPPLLDFLRSACFLELLSKKKEKKIKKYPNEKEQLTPKRSLYVI